MKKIIISSTGLIGKLAKRRYFHAEDLAGNFLASASLYFPHGSKKALVKNISVNLGNQGQGVGKQLFNHLVRFAKKAKRTHLDTADEIVSPKMIKLRHNIGSKFYKFSGKSKKLIDKNTAIAILKGAKDRPGNYPSIVKASTNLKNIKFIRKNGRIIPIRIKK
jgi:GNAT superfamily N-acetyltransferase